MERRDPRTQILQALDDGPRTQRDLMQAAGVSRRRLFTLVQELSDAGRVRKLHDLRDMRRRVYVAHDPAE